MDTSDSRCEGRWTESWTRLLRDKYPSLFTEAEVNNCFGMYHTEINEIKKNSLIGFSRAFHEIGKEKPLVLIDCLH